LSVEEGDIEDLLFEEVLIDFIHLKDSGPDEGLQGDLVDDPGKSLCEVEDELGGGFGEEVFGALGAFDVEADIIAGIIDGEASEGMCETDALFEGFILRLFESEGEFLRPREDEGEAVFGIHGEVGEGSEEFQEDIGEGVAVVKDKDGVFCTSFFILSEGSADGVEQIGLMVKDGQAEDATEASEEAGGGGAQIEQIEKIIPAIVELFFESPEADAFAYPWGSTKQSDSPGLQPQMESVDELSLSGCIEHFFGPHVLGEGDFGETEVGFKVDALFFHDCPPKN
jgi:hypothetical protein